MADLAELHGVRLSFALRAVAAGAVAAAQLAAANWHVGPLQVEPTDSPLGQLLDPMPQFDNGFLIVPPARAWHACAGIRSGAVTRGSDGMSTLRERVQDAARQDRATDAGSLRGLPPELLPPGHDDGQPRSAPPHTRAC